MVTYLSINSEGQAGSSISAVMRVAVCGSTPGTGFKWKGLSLTKPRRLWHENPASLSKRACYQILFPHSDTKSPYCPTCWNTRWILAECCEMFIEFSPTADKCGSAAPTAKVGSGKFSDEAGLIGMFHFILFIS